MVIINPYGMIFDAVGVFCPDFYLNLAHHTVYIYWLKKVKQLKIELFPLNLVAFSNQKSSFAWGVSQSSWLLLLLQWAGPAGSLKAS